MCGANGNHDRPVFVCDWISAVFINYETDVDLLQREVPYKLDLFHSKGYVSLVAFTIHALRPSVGGPLAAWVFSPISTHRFLNVRTYVRHRGEPGIYFLREWLDNPLSVLLGRPTFGLPYHFGNLKYNHNEQTGEVSDTVRARGKALKFTGKYDPSKSFKPCEPESLDNFIMERYTAFTAWMRLRILFRVGHPPWLQTPLHVEIEKDNLLSTYCPWHRNARTQSAFYSPGVRNVSIGMPRSAASAKIGLAGFMPSTAGS